MLPVIAEKNLCGNRCNSCFCRMSFVLPALLVERGASSLPPLTQQEPCKAGDAPEIWSSVRISTALPEAQQPRVQCFIQGLCSLEWVAINGPSIRPQFKNMWVGSWIFCQIWGKVINEAGAVIVTLNVSFTPSAAASCTSFLEPWWLSSLLKILNNFGELLLEFSWNNHNHGADLACCESAAYNFDFMTF